MKHLYTNNLDLPDGRLLEYSQVFDEPTHRQNPLDREEYEPLYEIDGESVSREDVLAYISAEVLAQLIDSATEVSNWRPEEPDHEH